MSQSPVISPVVTVWCSRPRARWSLSLAAGATGHQSVGQSALCKAPKSASAPGPPGSHYLCALVGMCLVFGVVYLVFGVIGLESSVMYMLFRATSFPLVGRCLVLVIFLMWSWRNIWFLFYFAAIRFSRFIFFCNLTNAPTTCAVCAPPWAPSPPPQASVVLMIL